MRVLLDENLPHDLIEALPGHSVSTVHGHGWAGTTNGALLKRASGVVDAFVTMLQGPAGTYHLGTEDERTIRDVALEVARALGRTIRVERGELTPGSTLRRCPDTAKLRALGFLPKVAFAEAIARTVTWYRDHPRP